ncbi:MAG: hypothetical protein IJD67_02475 [Clostridia bacterium]|nr:hypothetical protein [Clostridia bacterium]
MNVRDLYNCTIGKSYRVNKLLLDRNERMLLGAVGLNKKACVSVSVRNTNGVIINVHGAKLALSKKLSKRIVIE